MKVAIDTSVLVAAAIEDDPRHAAALSWIQTRKRIERFASLHAFAEAWAVLTTLPIDPPVTGQTALLVLERLGKVLRFVAPTARVYASAAERCAMLHLRSGAIFDALHVAAAESAGADAILTFDESDFRRLVLDGGPRVIVPSREGP